MEEHEKHIVYKIAVERSMIIKWRACRTWLLPWIAKTYVYVTYILLNYYYYYSMNIHQNNSVKFHVKNIVQGMRTCQYCNLTLVASHWDQCVSFPLPVASIVRYIVIHVPTLFSSLDSSTHSRTHTLRWINYTSPNTCKG